MLFLEMLLALSIDTNKKSTLLIMNLIDVQVTKNISNQHNNFYKRFYPKIS